MPLRTLAALLLLSAAPVLAQVRIATVEPLVGSPGAERPVVLQAAEISVERAGGLAHTTIELTLHNPSDRPLEGQLAFPLRDGQQMSGFALDIDGLLHDAVPVAKQRGREVFEAIERRQVDPALLERSEGNFFRLRVFPVPAQGERRVRIELVEALRLGDDGWRLQLPLQFAAGLASVPLHVAGDAPSVAADAGTLHFAAADGGVAATLGPRQLKATGGLDLGWARTAGDAALTQEYDGDVWFLAELALRDQLRLRRLPARIGLLWDASGSAGKRDHGLEFALLDRYFAAAGDVDVQLQLLRERAAPVQRFRIAGGDWSALKAALRSAVNDGATDLGAWKPAADVGEYLLVSDGLANFGDGTFPAFSPSQRLFAISSAGAAADSARLQALAEARGGRLVAVNGAGGLADAADELLAERARIVAIDVVGAADVVAASPFVDQGRLRIGGRLTAADATINLTLSGSDGTRHTQKIAVAQGAPGQGRFLAQVVAGWTLRTLQADPVGNATTIRMLGQRFGLVTAETSLIVLETLEDHLTYDIPPPPPWRAEFDARRLVQQTDRDQWRRNNLDEVAAAFAERRAWWETDFRGRRHAPDDEAKIVADALPAPTSMPAPVSAPEPMPSPVDESGSGEPMPVTALPAPRAAVAVAADRAAGAAEASAREEERSAAARMQRADSDTIDAIEVTGSVIAAPESGRAADIAAATIALQPWAPDSDVARRLRAAPAADVYRLYLDERSANADSPAFYLDVADILLEKGRRDEALRVLSNLAELQLENRALLRVLGYRLLQAGEAELAVAVLARVRTLADEEPQSHRDLGLALDAAGRHQAAADALYEVVARPWDERFGGIALIALAELNAIVARDKGRIDTSAYDPRLLRNLPMALRAVLTWDADATDMDLWVIQPDGEEVSYNNHDSVAGGRLSDDFTGGYGPEEYAIRRGRDGIYRIEVDHYGSSSQLVTGAVTVQVWLSTGFGTPAQRDRRLIVRLQPQSDRLLVGEFRID